jgi:hypothetical protein
VPLRWREQADAGCHIPNGNSLNDINGECTITAMIQDIEVGMATRLQAK